MLEILITFPLLLIKVFLYTLHGILKCIIPMSMWWKKSVEGELVLVTGAGSGIGRQIALHFARNGANLVLWDVNTAGNEETARMVRELGVTARAYECDVSNRQNVYNIARRVKNEVGVVTILVNNAGIVSGNYFVDLPDDKIIKTINVNTMAHFWTIRAFLPDMINNGHGHLVTISSIVAEGGIAGLTDYCASKSAVKGLHESIMREILIANSKVKCTVVCPYTVTTGMFQGVKVNYQSLVQYITPEYVGEKIVEAVMTDTDTLYLPPYMFIAVLLAHILPTKAQLAIEEFMNANEAMKSFEGKGGIDKTSKHE